MQRGWGQGGRALDPPPQREVLLLPPVLSECALCRAGVWGQTTCASPICTRQWLSSGVPVSPRDKCQRLEMLLCVPTGRCSWHLVGGSQGCCSGHRTAPNSDLAPAVHGACLTGAAERLQASTEPSALHTQLAPYTAATTTLVRFNFLS